MAVIAMHGYMHRQGLKILGFAGSTWVSFSTIPCFISKSIQRPCNINFKHAINLSTKLLLVRRFSYFYWFKANQCYVTPENDYGIFERSLTEVFTFDDWSIHFGFGIFQFATCIMLIRCSLEVHRF